jgi:hypothetical protein
MERAVREQGMPSAMAKQVLQEGAGLPHYEFAYLADAGPASATDTPDYQSLKASGFDTVLELRLTSLGFEGFKGEPPWAVLEMELHARVVPLSGQGSPFVRELQHRGQWRRVPEWTADDGKPLQEALLETYRALALDLSSAVLWPVSAE